MGLVPRDKFLAFGEVTSTDGSGYTKLVRMIETSSPDHLPGFIGPEQALSTSDTKVQAIERFGDVDYANLPVVDRKQRFVGVLNRDKLQSKLLASILRAARVSR